jgi:tRNA(Ile)-lysidine synthase
VPAAEEAVRDEEASALFRGLEGLPGIVIAVSGGPDSTALLLLAVRWAKRQKRRQPKLIAVTIDHGLRPQAAAEAAAVKRLARSLGVAHTTLRWRDKKPKSGLQNAARVARYRLLAQAATRAGYAHIMTAHTLDDQAETVLFRLARGSGITGLAGMATASLLPVGDTEIFLVRPLLQIPKSRLVATLKAAGVSYAKDPSNNDPRFARARLRALMPALAREGLDARGLSRLAVRLRRAEATIEFAVRAARAALTSSPWRAHTPIVFEGARFAELPAEVGLRLLGRAIAHAGNEGPVELGKLEVLYDALRQASGRMRRTLAGAVVTLAENRLRIERAPARRATASR